MQDVNFSVNNFWSFFRISNEVLSSNRNLTGNIPFRYILNNSFKCMHASKKSLNTKINKILRITVFFWQHYLNDQFLKEMSWNQPGVVACTCNPAFLMAQFWDGVGLIPVGGNSPSIGGWIMWPPVIWSLTKYWD